MKLNAKQLRSLSQIAHGNLPAAISPLRLRSEASHKQSLRSNDLKPQEIYIILDNVLDTYNIGSVFRLADAVSAKKIYLCSGTATPPNHRIKKASINTMEIVEWSYFESTIGAVREIREILPKIQIVAVEQSEKSVQYDKYDYKLPIALVVGHESDGVSKEVLKMCDAVVELPMYGVNISLNVMVSLGIVLYKVVEKCLLK